MKKTILLILFTLNFLVGQSSSVYSNFGIGELNVNPTARRSGFGLGVAGADNFDINPLNPASVYQLKFVKFSASGNYNVNVYSDKFSENKYSTGFFDYLLLAIPLHRDYGIVLSGGISPLTRVRYNVLSPTNYFDSIPYIVKYEGLGGITNYNIGLSYKTSEYGAFGISSNFLIGTINKKLTTDFEDQSLINPTFTKEIKFNGLAVRFGYISENLKNYYKEIPLVDLRVGISYLSRSILNTEILELKQGIFIDTTDEFSSKSRLPEQLAMGISAKFNQRLNLYVDYLNHNWTKLKTVSISNFSLVNQNYFSIGVEYLPNPRPEKFVDAITYRLGAFYKNLGVVVNNEKINEYGFKAGISFPIDQLNLIDVGLQYSIRGKKQNDLVKESLFNIWIGINFAEIWFVRSEE